MSLSQDYDLLPPASIIIKRAERQRASIDVSDLLDSIRQRGVIHPIIVTRELVLRSCAGSIFRYFESD
jgi:ParB-like chromosome segregation protein Spo0J